MPEGQEDGGKDTEKFQFVEDNSQVTGNISPKRVKRNVRGSELKKIRTTIKKIKFIVTVLGLLLLMGCGKQDNSLLGQAEVLSADQDGFTGSLAAAVEITAGNQYGRGVVYDRDEQGLILVTAGHVIPAATEADGISITFQDGQTAVCSGYALAAEADCAFLRVFMEDIPAEGQEDYQPVKKDRDQFDALESGTGIFLADPRADNELGCHFAMVVENWIYVEDFSQHMMLLSGEAYAGMSGAGVFDEEGCFLGILCGGSDAGELAVLPYSVIETNYGEVSGKERF